MQDLFAPILPIALTLLAISLFGYRLLCLRWSGRPANGAQAGNPLAGADPRLSGPPAPGAAALAGDLSPGRGLRPAELAYLIREGDRSHATVVLAFDLLHRAIKSIQGDASGVNLAPYEERVFIKVKEFARRWLEEKTGQLVPDPRSRDVRLIARQVSGLYGFLVKSVRPFVSEVLEDPRRIRRYFTVAGLMRLLADVGSAGYREALESEMVLDMMSRGLLVSEPARKRAAKYLTFGFVAGFVLTLAIVFFSVANQPLGIVAFVTSGIVALGLRLVWGLREFLPMYSELRDVANHIRRTGWRLVLLRFVLRVVGGVLHSLVAVVGLALLGLQILCLHLIFAAPTADSVLLALMLCAVWLFLLELAFEAYKMNLRSQPSLEAIALIAESRQKLAGVSPVEAFRELLASREYNPQCSELLAIYGIETLFVLA